MEHEPRTSPAEDRLEALQRQRAQRRRRQFWSSIITLFAIVLLTGAVILILNDGASMLAGLLSDQPSAPQTDENIDEAQSTMDKYSTVTIAAVGDIAISDSQLADARSSDGNGYDFAPCFLGAADLLADADLTIGNLECSFSGAPYGSAASSAPAVLADTLAGLGFDLLQTANSASILGGMAGLEATIDAIENAGMQPVGTFKTAQDRRDSGGVTIREVNGIRVAFIAFTKGLGNMSLPEDAEHAVNLLYSDYDTNYRNLDTEGIITAMEEARKKEPDVIIALLHWGSEYSREISKSQKQVEKLLYENGADAIIGTHSHMVGELKTDTITLEGGTSKDVLTAYDLGNFYAESTKPGTQMSLVLELEFTRNNWTDKTTLTNYSYTPVFCADFGVQEANRYQVLNMENAMTLYQQDYVYRVSDETYEILQSELEKLPVYLSPPEEEDE